MQITDKTVVALTWTLSDSLGEVLDELAQPAEFLVGSEDLLPAISNSLLGREAGATLNLNLEPEDAFGDYDEQRVFLATRAKLPQGLEEGMLIEGAALPEGAAPGALPDAIYTITEIYPEHVVLDANHPLAGISLRLRLSVQAVRAASAQELARGTAGAAFFKLQSTAPGSAQLH